MESLPESALFERLSRFATALSLAYSDRLLELSGERITYFYDTNVVYPMIQGFEASLSGRLQTARQTLVRSLLGCGRLGVVEMLGPHAIELEKKLTSLKPARKESQEALRSRYLQFLSDRPKERKFFDELSSIAADAGAHPNEEKVESFLDVLRRGQSADAFITIEQINGTWNSRLRRFYDQGILNFGSLKFNVKNLMQYNKPLVLEIFDILNEQRPGARVPNLYDSMALALLALAIRERDAGEGRESVRFHTHHSVLYDAVVGNGKLRSLLSYRSTSRGGSLEFQGCSSEAFYSIFRNDDYYLTRLRFDELSFGHGETPESLDEVRLLIAEIDEILEDHEDDNITEDSVASVEWQGRPLIQVLDEFEELSLIDSIWVRHRLPEDFSRNMQQWSDVFAFVDKGELRDSLQQRVEDIQHDLHSKVSQMRRWADDFRMLHQGSRETRRKIQKQLENPMRDLGLVRWGYSLSRQLQIRLIESVKALLQSEQEKVDQREHDEICSQLAGHMEEARTDLEECLFMGAVLWAIGKYRDLVFLIDQCSATVDETPPTLRILRAAAVLKSLNDVSLPRREGMDRRKEIVADVHELWSELPTEDAGGYLLGIGYVLYHAWKSASGAISLGDFESSEEVEVREWAAESLRAGREARRLLDPGSLAWAFAVNHCAYVGLVTQASTEEESDKDREVLLGLYNEPVWNSRFADTLGCFYLISMEREWDSTPAADRGRLNFETRVRRAEELFQAALFTDFGDIDLPSHIKRLESIKDKFESAQQRKNHATG